jgi:hypothetical protein
MISRSWSGFHDDREVGECHEQRPEVLGGLDGITPFPRSWEAGARFGSSAFGLWSAHLEPGRDFAGIARSSSSASRRTRLGYLGDDVVLAELSSMCASEWAVRESIQST